MAELTPEQRAHLMDVSHSFLSDPAFSFLEIELVMEEIFGNYAACAANATARSWSTYWDALTLYEEERHDNPAAVPPNVQEHSLF